VSVQGKVIVVTGAARGLGAGMATSLAGKGARVALLDRDVVPLEGVVATCGAEARGWEVDVTDAAALTRVAGEVIAHFGGVDVLVVNAGIGAGGTFLESEPEDHERVIEVNLLGSIRTARAFLPALVERRGYLLQLASIAALVPAPLMSAYCASKSGVEAFAHSVRAEVAASGVTVGVAYLGFVDTDMVRSVDADPVLAGLRAAMPWPFGVTRPVGPSVARLVRGIEARRVHLYSPGWTRLLPLVRGLMPMIVARRGRSALASRPPS
jgi:NAD(P)-dependent dehydrogenase (short-subunit alcohol dehydrogenase family)